MQRVDVSREGSSSACAGCGGPTRGRGGRCEACDPGRAEQGVAGRFDAATPAGRASGSPKARRTEPRRLRADTRPGLGLVASDAGVVAEPVPGTRRAHPAMIRSALAEAQERSELPPTAAIVGARAESVARELIDGGRARLRDERPLAVAASEGEADVVAARAWPPHVAPHTLVIAALSAAAAVLALLLVLR